MGKAAMIGACTPVCADINAISCAVELGCVMVGAFLGPMASFLCGAGSAFASSFELPCIAGDFHFSSGHQMKTLAVGDIVPSGFFSWHRRGKRIERRSLYCAGTFSSLWWA